MPSVSCLLSYLSLCLSLCLPLYQENLCKCCLSHVALYTKT